MTFRPHEYYDALSRIGMPTATPSGELPLTILANEIESLSIAIELDGSDPAKRLDEFTERAITLAEKIDAAVVFPAEKRQLLQGLSRKVYTILNSEIYGQQGDDFVSYGMLYLQPKITSLNQSRVITEDQNTLLLQAMKNRKRKILQTQFLRKKFGLFAYSKLPISKL